MKVLSWDVGLRTLSYCLMENVEGSSTRFHILDWDSIDVQVDNDEESAPGTIRPSKRVKTAAVSIEQGARLIMDALHRRACVLAEGVDAIIIEQQPAGGHNQQSNVRMKVMSHAIQCYFYTRAIVGHTFIVPTITFVAANSKFCEKPKASDNVTSEANVTGEAIESEVRAGSTPAESEVAADSTPTESRGVAPSRYSQNKKYAVLKTRELLEANMAMPGCTDEDSSNDKARLMFESITTKKKDDLADSFLLGFYYLRKHTAEAAPKVKRARAPRQQQDTTDAAPKIKRAPRQQQDTTDAAPKVKRAPRQQPEDTTDVVPKVKRAPRQQPEDATDAAPKVKRARASKPKATTQPVDVDANNATSAN